MFDNLLSQCWENYKDAECCHENNNFCNCYNCLNNGFFSHSDEYDCEKKMLFYVLNYGASYISEFYHYLSKSEILNNFHGNLNVLSLGCGFCPDYYALSKYITDNKLNIQISHIGIDNSVFWNKTRINHSNINYYISDLTDLTNPLSFQGYNIITVNKVFSSLYGQDNHISFLQNIGNAVKTSMENNAILIFNDVNHIDMGRDVFDQNIKRYFNNILRYYTDIRKAYFETSWVPIPKTNVIYLVNNYDFENITPLNTVTKTVFFEYRK
jgi:hypothetical protein